MKDMTQLQYFRTVAEMEHLTHAASELHISQPNLSNAIRRLEESVGAQLFDRRNGHIYLNEYGQIYLQAVNAALSELSAAQDKIRLLAENRQDFSVSIASSLHKLNEQMLDKFLSAHPNTKLQFRQQIASPVSIAKGFSNGTIEMAVTTPINLPAKVHWNHVFSCKIGILMPNSHPLASRQSILLGELANERFLCNSVGINRALLEQYCLQAGFLPNIILETNDSQTIGRWIEQGRGISLISAYEAMLLLSHAHPASLPVSIRKIAGTEPQLSFGLAFDPEHRPLICEPLYSFATTYFKALADKIKHFWSMDLP